MGRSASKKKKQKHRCKKKSRSEEHQEDDIVAKLPYTVFEQMATMLEMDDLISLAHCSKTLHRTVSGLHWKCGTCVNRRVFQGYGTPVWCRGGCEQLRCPECTEFCGDCLETKCRDCDLEFCERCEEYYCDDCRCFVYCDGCHEMSCENCDAGGTCSCCGFGLCFECGYLECCAACGELSCSECNEESDDPILQCTLGDCRDEYCRDCTDWTLCASPVCEERMCSRCHDNGSRLANAPFCSESCQEEAQMFLLSGFMLRRRGGGF